MFITAGLAAMALAASPALPSGFTDVRAAGAFGDGRSHPLWASFSSLDEARAAFPRAASLDEELDAHVIQRAIDDAPVAARSGSRRASTASTSPCACGRA